MLKGAYILIVSLLIFFLFSSFYVGYGYHDVYSIYQKSDKTDSILNQMSLDEKLGQLFMVPVYTSGNSSNYAEVKTLIDKYKIGGVIFMKGHPGVQAQWCRQFQNQSKTPLLVAMDAEWGLDMRLDSVVKYAKEMTLGALDNDSLIYAYGLEMARQLKIVGANVSFSPVVDINSNPNNPVIHMRSFGEDKYAVAKKGLQYMRGLQEGGVIAVAKHFPGHGNTETDSHLDLPVITTSRKKLLSEEIYPFEHLIENGVAGVMLAHIYLPALEYQKNIPASLSYRIGTRLLRKDLDFDGITFSDALNMKGVTSQFDNNEIDLRAILAGNDMLLFPQNIPASIEKIKEALDRKIISIETINEKVGRILNGKQWVAKESKESNYKAPNQMDVKGLSQNANRIINHRVAENCITLLANERLPLQIGRFRKTTCISIGALDRTFINQLTAYGNVKTLGLPVQSTKKETEAVLSLLSKNDTIILSLNDINPYQLNKNFGLSTDVLSFINAIIKKENVIVVNFGSPYFLSLISKPKTLLQSFENLEEIQSKTAQIIYGALVPKGHLPVSVPDKYEYGDGLKFRKTKLLTFGIPEQESMHSKKLNQIDSIAKECVKTGAAPGCQVLVVKNNRVIYQKSFGIFCATDSTPVDNQSIYDLASITKVASTTLMTMRAYDNGLIDINKKLGYYLGNQIDSVKGDLGLKELLTHQSGLVAWIPFYKYTLTKGGICDSNYCYMPDSYFSLQVAESLYIQKDMPNQIYKIMLETPLKKRGEYVYSDLGFLYLKKILDDINSNHYRSALYRSFYNPMGLRRTLFNPLDRFSKSQIVPTEIDDYFRHQLIHGYVHDPAAAMMGGEAGHAGLFSNSLELATIMQMLLNGGEYGGQRFIQASTVKLFTSKQFDNNRKGLGFDKNDPDTTKPSPAIKSMSADAFGHTGFTGTCVWADPKYNLIYVFLSNRVYPNAENKKLITKNIRTRIMQVVYNDIKSSNR